MTVGELKELLEWVDDGVEVTIEMRFADEWIFNEWWRRRSQRGLLGRLADLIDPLPDSFGDQRFCTWVGSAGMCKGLPRYGWDREFRIRGGNHGPEVLAGPEPPLESNPPARAATRISAQWQVPRKPQPQLPPSREIVKR